MREDKIQRISKIFSALGNDVRVKILLLVSETRKPLHIKAVAKALNMDYAALSVARASSAFCLCWARNLLPVCSTRYKEAPGIGSEPSAK